MYHKEITTADEAEGGQEKCSTHAEHEKAYPPTKKVIPAMTAGFLVFFIVALDRTIIGTAIPSISAEFGSFGDIAWYESAFLLPLCVLQLSFGLIYTYYSTKWTLWILAAVFGVGSIVCATAPTSNALIVGRAITGIGGAGIGPGVYVFVTLLLPLKDRPKFFGAFGAAFGISSILGPLLGGYLTSVTWRWCFWINLPIVGLALILLLLLGPNAPAPKTPPASWRKRVLDLDPGGFVLIATSIVCLLFSLEFGGQDRDWSEARIIALFVIFGVFLIAFIGYQIWKGDEGTTPPSIISHRSVYIGCVVNFCLSSCLVIYSFYLPIWFQVVQSKSPSASGLSLLPLFLSTVISVISSGAMVSLIGYYTPFAIIGGAFLVVGAGLITSWTADISEGRWVGYQIITGIGQGLSLQQPAIAAQTVLSEQDIPIGTTILTFLGFLGGAVFVTVAQTLLENQLAQRLGPLIPGLDPAVLAGSGAAALRTMAPPERLSQVLEAYNEALKSVWYLGLGISCVAFVASCALPWRSVKTEKATTKGDAKV